MSLQYVASGLITQTFPCVIIHVCRIPCVKKEDSVSSPPLPFLRICRRMPQALCGLGLSLLLTGSACSLQPKSPPLSTRMTMASFSADSHLGRQSAEEALQKGPLVVLFYRGHW